MAKEETMRLMDEIEQELESVEWGLRVSGVENDRKVRWEGYCDALKWVLLYLPEYGKGK